MDADAILRIAADIAEAKAALEEIRASVKDAGNRIKETAPATKAWGDAWKFVKGAIPIVTISGAATALVSLGKSAIESADKIVDLSTKTGHSTDAIQRMQHVANKTGTDVEAFTNAAFRLGVTVAEGTTKARDAVSELGLSYTALKAMRPEEQFAAVMRALEGMTNEQDRNRLGQALFGKQFSELVVSIKEGYTEIAGGARIVADEHLKALKEAGEAWQQFKTDVDHVVTSILGGVVIAAKSLGTGLKDLTAQEQQLIAATKKSGGDLQAVIEQIRLKHEQLAASRQTAATTTTALITVERDYVGELADAQDRLKNLTVAERAQLEAALKTGVNLDDLKEQYQLTDASIRLYQASQRDATKAATEHARELEKAKEKQQKFLDSVSSFTPTVASILPAFSNIRSNLTDLDRHYARLEPLTSTLKHHYDAFVRLKAPIESTTEALKRQTAEALKAREAFKSMLSNLASALNQLAQTAGDSFGGVARWLATTVSGVHTASEASDVMVGGWKKLSGESRNVADGLGRVAAGATTAAAAMMQAVSSGTTLQRAISGAATAAALSPWLAPIGFAIGWMAGKKAEVEEMRMAIEGVKQSLIAMLTTAQRLATSGNLGGSYMQALEELFQKVGKTSEDVLRVFRDLNQTDDPQRLAAAIREITVAMQRLADLKVKAGGLFDQIMQFADKTGGVPENVRAMIDQFIRLGLLTDEQAAKLRGLGDSGAMDLRKMEQAAQLFGGRLEALGPAFKQAKINETAMEMSNALDYLFKHGADVGGVLFDAREEISKLVQDSLQFGVKIPGNMRPWIEELIRAGLLLDAQGNKIIDSTQLDFGESLKTEAELAAEGWDKILAAIQALIDEIKGPLEKAINDVVTKDRPPIEIDVDYRWPEGSMPGDPYRPQMPHRDFPAGTQTAYASSAVSGAMGGSAPGGAPLLAPTSTNSDSTIVLAPVVVRDRRDVERVMDEWERGLPRGVAGNRNNLRIGLLQALGLA